MRNFNIKYDSAKVYSNFEEFKLEDKRLPSPLISLPSLLAIILPAKINPSFLKTNIACIIINNINIDFNSLYLPCVAHKQT